MKKILVGLAIVFLVGSLAVGQTLISTSLSSISGQYTLVYLYNATSGSWAVYNPYAVDPGYNSLNYTSEKWGYWLNVNASSATLNVTGTVPSSTDIGVVSGWNLVGYPSTTAQLASTTFSGISGQYTLVYLYNATSGSWAVYNPYAVDPGYNSLNYTSPGYGYWLNVNATSATLTV